MSAGRRPGAISATAARNAAGTGSGLGISGPSGSGVTGPPVRMRATPVRYRLAAGEGSARDPAQVPGRTPGPPPPRPREGPGRAPGCHPGRLRPHPPQGPRPEFRTGQWAHEPVP
ncbi:hypothetical protein GCM10018785_60780 [Streptomyces longispororuber]|uniref:Uncharacterized protein n=1 Tax=Streptomyces longispororuber TaxID=68230 RepID=A0A919A2M0_9ACTN|nr:hypothetical protein GCM10018785_60780 [Streptomyces longispororuber]